MGLGTTVGMALPFSRSQEREADHRGLFYAAMAGYDPRGAIAFWEKMQGWKVAEKFLNFYPLTQIRAIGLSFLKRIWKKHLLFIGKQNYLAEKNQTHEFIFRFST